VFAAEDREKNQTYNVRSARHGVSEFVSTTAAGRIGLVSGNEMGERWGGEVVRRSDVVVRYGVIRFGRRRCESRPLKQRRRVSVCRSYTGRAVSSTRAT